MNLKDLFLSYEVVKPEEPEDEDIILPDFSLPYFDRAKAYNSPTSDTTTRTFPTFTGWGAYRSYSASTPTSIQTNTPSTSTSTSTSTASLTGVLGKYSSKKQFTLELTAAYKKAGCSDSYAKMLVGQDGGESGWGKSIIGDFNYGNVTAGSNWKGRVREYHNKNNNTTYHFRSYDTLDAYVANKLNVLKHKYHMTGNETVDEFADKLAAGGYAEGKNYKQALLSWIKSV